MPLRSGLWLITPLGWIRWKAVGRCSCLIAARLPTRRPTPTHAETDPPGTRAVAVATSAPSRTPMSNMRPYLGGNATRVLPERGLSGIRHQEGSHLKNAFAWS